MTAGPRTLQQKRAAHALSIVHEVSDDFASHYRSYVESLPATIVMNGLGQACATLMARSRDNSPRARAYDLLYKHLQDWLCRSEAAVYPQAESLIDAIVKNDQEKYVHAQAEALAYLDWLKKFAQAFLKAAPADSGGSNYVK
ncbi:MAG: type III-B CRISPR module-associated protein Cmr5 [Acidobacteriota bacterium]